MENKIYNTEQLKFINYPIQDCKLLGIPGGGKTQSIIGKIIHHYKNKDINENNNFLILTFSRRACNDFIEKGKKENNKYFTTKNIRTIHSLAGKIVHKILDKKSSSQDTVIISSIELMRKNTEEVLKLDELSSLKVIFVDEAQDISYIQYQFILTISKITNSSVILIGDPNQNIYQFQNGSDQYLINHPGHNFQLIYNYRSTSHIVNFINYFRPWEKLTSKMLSTKEENDPFNKKPIIFRGTVEDVIQNVIDKILNSHFLREEIAIIGPVKKSKPTNDSYTNIGLSLFTNILHKHNILYVKHFEDTNNEETSITNDKKKPDHINIYTIHGSKGLEFKQVFLLNFHTSTFGIIPTEEKYKEFKYLWYVGISRAIYDLHIYMDVNKNPWNELRNVPSNLYEIENIRPVFRELKFKEEIIPFYFSVTDIINSKKYLNDQLFYDLENTFKYEIEEIKLFDNPRVHLNKDYSALYGMFMENIFNYTYTKKRDIEFDQIIKLKKIINLSIIIPKEYINAYKILKIRCPFIKDIIKLSDFKDIKNLFKKLEEDLYSYLCELLEYDYNKEFFLQVENHVIHYSKNDLLQYCEELDESETKDIQIILKITIFFYQMSHETSYLWDVDFTDDIIILKPFIDNIIEYANREDLETFDFHHKLNHPKLPIIGELDMNNEKKIIDIKFTNTLNIKHILQILIYNNMLDVGFKEDYQLEIWNFYIGSKFIIKLDKSELNIFKLLKILSKAINKKIENMIIIYDLETTGLAYSGNKMDIIERHFEEYSTNTILSTGLLKPVNVPFIPFQITALTGITKEMVYSDGDSFDTFRKEINDILNICNMPIFIAHNGNSFDHRILIDRNILSYDKCRFLDSKIIIRLFMNSTVSNRSLSDIFQHLFGFLPVVHRANSDVKMLISIFRKLNINEEKILNIK
jgi:DNA polymerase III epsilon subunit-like protein